MVLFEETQKFRQNWLWLFLSIFSIGSIFYLYYLNDLDAILVMAATMVATFSLFYFASLRTKVTENGIHIKFFPFHLSERLIRLDEIEELESGVYSPIKEFGGWGLRWRPNKIAYNVSGNKGVRITKKTGKQIVIGSQRPKEFEQSIKEAMN